MSKILPRIRAGSKIFDLEVPGIDEYGLEALFDAKIAIHYSYTTINHVKFKFYTLIAGEWIYINHKQLEYLLTHTELGTLHRKFEKCLNELHANPVFTHIPTKT